MTLDYTLSYAGVPFVSDVARLIRTPSTTSVEEVAEQTPPRKYQPLADLVDELNRLIPFSQLKDFGLPPNFNGKTLSAIAYQSQTGPLPDASLPIGVWYYPNSATRWSVFRGLATSTQAKAMLAATGGDLSATFMMQQNPIAPNHPDNDFQNYQLTSSMFMLPPRPLAEMGGTFDGLYLITLVDERYWWQYAPVLLQVTPGTTWDNLIATIGSSLNITPVYSPIPTVYGIPEPDSQLWAGIENAGVLFDAVCLNVGRTVVRNLNGSYNLYTYTESSDLVTANRGPVNQVVRIAGGDLFASGNALPAGDLFNSQNSIVPSNVIVSFPQYIIGNDPVPHFVNPRYQPQRPSTWFEDSFGVNFNVTIPITSGGVSASGLTGTVYSHNIHSTAKALYSGELYLPLPPLNSSGLMSLALQIAGDFYASQVATALDEVYPGTFAWTPEGIHDIIWTYSERMRLASTRVVRREWNQIVEEMQHATPPLPGNQVSQVGVGGKSVALTVRDTYSGSLVNTGTPSTTLASSLGTADPVAQFTLVDYFPTQNRWKGKIDSEIILFEGTASNTTVTIVFRGLDSTLVTDHSAGAVIQYLFPDTTYGTNLITIEKGQFAYTSDWTSGGIAGINLVPQVQTVQVTSTVPTIINGVDYYPGVVSLYDPSRTSGSQFVQLENIWVAERMGGTLNRQYYEGQLAGYSASQSGTAQVLPIYLTNQVLPPTGSGTGTCSPIPLSYTYSRCVNGYLNKYVNTVELVYANGCYSLVNGGESFVGVDGCCSCSNNQCCGCVIYTTALSTLSPGCGGNGSYTLTYTGNGCTWTGLTTDGSTVTMQMTGTIGSTVSAVFTTVGGCKATYIGTVSDCGGFSAFIVNGAIGTQWPLSVVFQCTQNLSCCLCVIYTFTLSGLSPGCGGNGIYLLLYPGTGCTWTAVLADGSTAILILGQGTNTIATLSIVTSGGCTGTYLGVISTVAGANCNQFTVNKTAISDSSLPASITITCGPPPSGSGSNCCPCLTYSVTISGLSPGCDGNGTYILSMFSSCIWKGTLPNGSTATLSATGGVGGTATLTIITSGECTATYSGTITDCNMFVLSLAPGSTGTGWSNTVPVKCITNSGSGSAPCIPGECSLCLNPPSYWTVDATAFAGTPCSQYFSAVWTLYQESSDCVWVDNAIIAGTPVSVSLIISATESFLSFAAFDNNNNIIANAAYVFAFPVGPDCCIPIVFPLDSSVTACNCPGQSTCPGCTNGIPSQWTVSFGNQFTGCLSPFNSTKWTLTEIGTCLWEDSTGTFPGTLVDISLTMTTDAATGDPLFLLQLQVEDGTTGNSCSSSVTYEFQLSLPSSEIDCCNPNGLLLNQTSFGVSCLQYTGGVVGPCSPLPTAPSTATIYGTNCQGGSPNVCPPTITAVPTCCPQSGSGSGGSCCDCQQYTLVVGGVTGAGNCTAFNGFYCLTLMSPCLWTGIGESGLSTATLYQSGGIATLVISQGTSEYAVYTADISEGCDFMVMSLKLPVVGGCTWPATQTIICQPCGESGSGSSGSGGTISSPCCPTVLLPSTLNANILSLGGCDTCFGAPGKDVLLTWNDDPVNPQWVFVGAAPACGLPSGFNNLTLSCNTTSNMWQLQGGLCNEIFDQFAFLTTCSPLQIVFSPVQLGFPQPGGCCDTAPATVTITITVPLT